MMYIITSSKEYLHLSLWRLWWKWARLLS